MAVNTSREDWKIYQNVFDKFTIDLIRRLISQDYFEELEMPLAVGKEANVFIAKTKSPDKKRVIVKIYRLENCNFNKMFDYIKQDPRYLSMRKNRRDIVFSWVQREYRNLLLAREAINVPTPIIFKNNILVLEMIGEPSPMLKDKKPKNPKKFLDLILKDVKSLWKQGLVHGDLSAFNILNNSEKPIFIDFSQATVTQSFDAKELLLRDLKNIKQFFAKLKTDLDVDETYNKIISK